MFQRGGFYTNFRDVGGKSKKGFQEAKLLSKACYLLAERRFAFRVSGSNSRAHGLKDATSP